MTFNYILIVLIGIAGWIVQARLQSVFARYAKAPFPGGLTGREVAERMLRENGVTDVRVISTPGHLTDHFDPRNKTVNLSQSVYNSSSVSAAAVACHECGHAVQHAEGYGPLKMRSTLVPVISFSSRWATWVILGGAVLMAVGNNAFLFWIGIAMVAVSALFALITLPVEYNASQRAIGWLSDSGMLQGEPLKQAREALSWAARTYLVAALSAIATLIYYITLASRD